MPQKMDGLSLYESVRQQKTPWFGRLLRAAWLVAGFSVLIWFAFVEPLSRMVVVWLIAHGAPMSLVNYLFAPIVMFLRAVLTVEVVGYTYHRFFQHLGFMTRRAESVRKSQQFHWIHHMVIYPIGRVYRREMAYVAAEEGIALSWVLPALATAVVFLLTHGVNVLSFCFIGGLWLYAQCIINKAHSRFHETVHPWSNSRYFHWLEEIHILHHWDQRKNFTIVHPLMDIIFGTYLSPRKHKAELAVALQAEELTVSDFINWRYLLIEATPAEYAAFVSQARRHSLSLQKLSRMLSVLNQRVAARPDDAEAANLQRRTIELFVACGKPPRL